MRDKYLKACGDDVLRFLRQPGRVLYVLAAKVAAWFLASVITILSLSPPDYRPESGLPHNLEHFAIFAAAGLCFGIGYRRRSIPVAIGLIAFAGTIELAQRLVHGRHARLSDFIVDAFALCVSVAVGAVVTNHYMDTNRGAAQTPLT
jgi:VanZ family protein